MEFQQKLPIFPVDACNVEILKEPKDFYEALKRHIKTAENQISLASLYIGSPELVEVLTEALAQNSLLQVNVLVDYFRGTRVENGRSTLSILAELKQQFPSQVHGYFYRSPNVAKSLERWVPARFIESFGLQHIKAYVFDDKLIISGANLNKDYFTDRQDRYMIISNPRLSSFFHDLVAAVASHSFVVQDQSLVKQDPLFLKTRLLNLLQSYSSESQLQTTKSSMCYIYPNIQVGYLDIYQEKTLLEELLLKKGWEYHIATAYFNLPNYLTSIIARNPDLFKILTSSPQANGFFNSRGVSKHVPNAYSYLSQLFHKKLRDPSPKLLWEYQRSGWTWHGKGVWGISSNAMFTTIGSSNLNIRSLDRDLEANLLLYTQNTQLIQKMNQNLMDLYENSKSVDGATLRKRKIPHTLKFFTRLLKSML